MVDVMFYEAFKEEERAIKECLPKGISAEFTRKTIQEYEYKNPPAKLISVRTQSCIPKEWAEKIDGILTRSQGYDHLIAFCREANADMSCGYLDNYCARAVAEQAILAMMALLRKLKKQITSFEAFSRDGLTGAECCGRKALIIGVGHIGSEIVDVVKGLRMEARGVDIKQELKNLPYVTLDEGIAWADIVFCALPLTQQTEGLLNYKFFQNAKPGIIFINVGRGEISPIEDLKKLLDEKILSGLGLDVYPQEPELAHSLRAGGAGKSSSAQTILDLSRREQVFFTPHNAFNTEEALKQKAALSVEAVVSYLDKGIFPHSVPCT